MNNFVEEGERKEEYVLAFIGENLKIVLVFIFCVKGGDRKSVV